MSNFLRKLGLEIKKRRLEMGMSQEDLAGYAEVDRSYLSEIENGKKNPSLTVLQKISEGLKIKPSQLLKQLGL